MSSHVIDFRELKSRARPTAATVIDAAETAEIDGEPVIRPACDADVDAIHLLVSEHLTEGRLLPRSRDEIARRVARFLVAVDHGRIVGCVDLAPLSQRVK